MKSIALSHAERLEGNEFDNKEMAIITLEETLEEIDPRKYGKLRSDLLNVLANFYESRPRGSESDNKSKATALRQEAFMLL